MICSTQVTFTQSNLSQNQNLQDQLTAPILSSDKEIQCNVTFVCANRETVKWNGLAFLGSISPIFKPLSGEEQNFTVLNLDYEASLVRKLLILISSGSSMVHKHEAEEITALGKDLGVRLLVFIVSHKIATAELLFSFSATDGQGCHRRV